MKKFMLLVLCLIMLSSFAYSESIIDFNGPGYDALQYACTLPDGRMIFTGYRSVEGNYQESRARLLCLNPDKTVSWEYFDPSEGKCGYGAALVREDGTLAVIFSNSPYQTLTERKIKYFTAEGEPLEKTEDIFREESLLNAVCPSFLEITVIPGDAEVFYRYFIDWDGNELFKISSDEMISVEGAFETEDGVVLMGCEPVWPSNAKIMKLDLKGNVLWETVLPTHLENLPDARLEYCRQTSDGGFLALYFESSGSMSDGKTPDRYQALVKFNQDGRLLWMNNDCFPQSEFKQCKGLCEYNGKYVMELNTTQKSFSISNPRVFLWFDEEGRELGQTELVIRREDLNIQADQGKIENVGGSFATFPDGLWMLRDILIENDNHMKEMDSRDVVLFKIPEL